MQGRRPIFNDLGQATMRVELKNPDLDAPTAPTPLNAITITRYHVEFRRTDGRNTPGVDVPYGFDGGVDRARSASGRRRP